MIICRRQRRSIFHRNR